MRGGFPTLQRHVTECALSEPVQLTHIRVTLPRILFREEPASFVIERLCGSRRKAGNY